ncbi:MAG: LytS/YhcK type 5TM receptor domain-containing protein [archaeon]
MREKELTKDNLFSKKSFIVSTIFGLFALLVVLGKVHIPIPGTSVVTDPRESFTTLGSALAGPIGGIIVGFLAGIAEPGGIALASLLAHISGAIWFGYTYKKFIYEKSYFFLRWIGNIIIYYYVFAVSGFSIGLVLFYKDPTPIIELYKGIAGGLTVELVLTILISSAILYALPKKYRKPVW